MNEKVVIIGAGGHAKVIADIVIRSNDELIGFLDDNISKETNIIENYKVIGTIKDAKELQQNDKKIKFIIGIGNNDIRKRISEEYSLQYYTAIHPSAIIGLNARIEEGTVVMANSIINPDSKIGKHCIINTGTIVEHENTIEDYVHLSPSVTLSGNVKVAKLVHIGTGCKVKNNIKSGKFNVYISGIDTSGNISNVSRSDANILMSINTNTHEALLTSIPRDYYVTLHSYGAKDKLTHSGIYGVNETVKTAEDLLDTDINYYVRVNFTTVIKLVDKLGGIDVYSDYNFSRDGYNFKKGYNHINGDAALVFSRERYSFASGDNQRVKNQQHVIEAIMKKVLNSTTLLTKYTDILDSLKGSFQTNIEQDDISKLVKDQINNMSSWTIKSNSLTGTGASSSTYSMGSTKLYVMVPNSTSVTSAKEKIDEVLGE